MRKKLSKMGLNWPLRPGPCPNDRDLGARPLGYSRAIFPASFVKIGLQEKGENGVTPGRPDARTPGRLDARTPGRPDDKTIPISA